MEYAKNIFCTYFMFFYIYRLLTYEMYSLNANKDLKLEQNFVIEMFLSFSYAKFHFIAI